MRYGHASRKLVARLGPPFAERGPIVVILALLAAGTVAMVRSAPAAELPLPPATAEAAPAPADPTAHVSASVARQSHIILIVASEADADALRVKLAASGLAGVRNSFVTVVWLPDDDVENLVFRSMLLGNEAMCPRTCGHVALIDLRDH